MSTIKAYVKLGSPTDNNGVALTFISWTHSPDFNLNNPQPLYSVCVAKKKNWGKKILIVSKVEFHSKDYHTFWK